MEKNLSNQQVHELEQSYVNGTLSSGHEINKLVEAGFERANAEQLVLEVIKRQRQKLFKERLHKKQHEEAMQVAAMITIMVSAVGPVFDVSSPLWYITALIIAGCAGYFGYKDKPLAGIIPAAALVILFPIAYYFYFSGRSSYINIEMLLPLLFSAIPAWLISWLISHWFYPD